MHYRLRGCGIKLHSPAFSAMQVQRMGQLGVRQCFLCTQVVVLLNGKPVTDYTFQAGVFKTTCAPPSTAFILTSCCARCCQSQEAGTAACACAVTSAVPKPGKQAASADGSPPRARSSPIEWETPTGKSATVNLELQLSAFFGYGKVAEDAYLGLQCHGVLWPAVTAEAPVHWPIAPPIVSGKARP